MTLYLSYNIDAKADKIISSEWSNTDIPVLAVSTDTNRITFFQDEGINITEHDIFKDSQITCLTWHPEQMIMGYGLLSGKVGVWIDEENFCKEEKGHDSKIINVKFNHVGNRVVSVDEKGTIIVWRYDGVLFKLCSYKQSFLIEDILFPQFQYEKMDHTKVPNQEKLSTLFFFSNSGGMLHLADDSNSSPEICRVGGKIKTLLFYEKENAIIIITSHMLLVKCTIHFNQQLTPKKLKLSIAGNPDSIKCTWASEGLIALISGDDTVRLFYLDTDQSYFLSMNDHELGRLSPDDSFNCIDFSSKKRILIVGSTKGKVYMWKCNLTANIIPISAESWEPFCIVDTIPNITEIKWSKYMGLVHIWNKSGSHAMLSETILQKKMNSKMKVLQISHKTIEISTEFKENSIGNQHISKKIDMEHTIKGISLYSNIILTWNGTVADIYDVNCKRIN